MKRWFRPVAYSLILVLVALAIFGGKAPADAAVVNAVPKRREVRAASTTQGQLAAVHERRRKALPDDLFAVSRPVPVAAPPVQMPAPAPPSIPDIKVLGWMLSESVPHVFVEWGNESHTLKPNESVGEVYRFDRVEAGFADFTYLPTGEARRYTVSDPALLE